MLIETEYHINMEFSIYHVKSTPDVQKIKLLITELANLPQEGNIS